MGGAERVQKEEGEGGKERNVLGENAGGKEKAQRTRGPKKRMNN